jgi:predicted ABC-type ATPase
MRKNKPVLIVVAGPNGSGKTTITERLLTHSWTDNATYINPDIIAQDLPVCLIAYKTSIL